MFSFYYGHDSLAKTEGCMLLNSTLEQLLRAHIQKIEREKTLRAFCSLDYHLFSCFPVWVLVLAWEDWFSSDYYRYSCFPGLVMALAWEDWFSSLFFPLASNDREYCLLLFCSKYYSWLLILGQSHSFCSNSKRERQNRN